MTGNSFPARRRGFIRSVAAATGAPLIAALAGLRSRSATAAEGRQSALVASPYGPLAPVNDQVTGLPLVKLPRGFSYQSHGWTYDPMSSGEQTPGNHDGMGVVRVRRVGNASEITLVRNHERRTGPAAIAAPAQYDRHRYEVPPGLPASALPPGTPNLSGHAAGGTTNIVFRGGRFVESFASLGGTMLNCAGGVTPWGTWLTCEETLANGSPVGGRRHGYVFEVRADAGGTTGVPIVGMGRLIHEAAAVDPDTGFVYQTEDSRNASGLYRYLPEARQGRPGSLEQGGRLQAARVVGRRNVDLIAPSLGDAYTLEWVDIRNPDADPQMRSGFPDFGPGGNGPEPGDALLSGPFAQGWDAGGLRMSRGEGIWYAKRRMYIVDTGAGLESRTTPPPRRGRGDGAVWQLDLDTQRLTCIHATPQGRPQAGNNADNITVSPRGGILLCEDGGTHVADAETIGTRLLGLTAQGDVYAFCENNQTSAVMTRARALGKHVHGSDPAAASRIGAEFAGACFDPSGQYLFVNLYDAGVTLAITGPWSSGAL